MLHFYSCTKVDFNIPYKHDTKFKITKETKLQCDGRTALTKKKHTSAGKSMNITQKPHIDHEIVQSIKANMKLGLTAEASGKTGGR